MFNSPVNPFGEANSLCDPRLFCLALKVRGIAVSLIQSGIKFQMFISLRKKLFLSTVTLYLFAVRSKCLNRTCVVVVL